MRGFAIFNRLVDRAAPVDAESADIYQAASLGYILVGGFLAEHAFNHLNEVDLAADPLTFAVWTVGTAIAMVGGAVYWDRSRQSREAGWQPNL